MLTQSICVVKKLVDSIRPLRDEPAAAAEQRIRHAIARLQENAAERTALREALQSILAVPHQSTLYCEAGIRSALGFWLELTKRCGEKLLPPPPDDAHLLSILQRLFPEQNDLGWIERIPEDTWLALWQAITLTDSTETTSGFSALRANLVEAATFASCRLAGGGLDRELLRLAPHLDDRTSPFLAQNALFVKMIESTVDNPHAYRDASLEALLDHLARCENAVRDVRACAVDRGISIRLSYQLSRLEQLSRRLRLLLAVLFPQSASPSRHYVAFFTAAIRGALSSRRIRPLLREDTCLLARNITENAGRRGEHYIAANRAEWLHMFRAAAGGGLIIAIMALVKMQFHALHLAPLTEGLAYSLNYSIGFVLIHLLGGSVATKQPAMTAASIAAALDEEKSGDLSRLVAFTENVARSQFIAVVGNIALALPAVCLLVLLWQSAGHGPIVTPETAHRLLEEVDPLSSGAVFYACVAGIGLFFSGLVSGYFDNRARYHALAQRIEALPAIRFFSPATRKAIGNYADAHYGAIAGNVFFGFFLGSVGQTIYLTGVPIEVRHVAFSAANTGIAASALGGREILAALPATMAGLAAIGALNLLSSFYLALRVAIWSRQLDSLSLTRLGRMTVAALCKHPLKFITPPRH